MKERTNKERLGAVETILAERLRVSIERRDEDLQWRTELDARIDKLIDNGKAAVTSGVLAEAISIHAKSCEGARNPGNALPGPAELVRNYWQLILALLGVIGGLVGIMEIRG